MAIDPGTALLISGGVGALGGLFGGMSQDKLSNKSLALQGKQLGLSREQFEFMKQQAMRQNQIQQGNTSRVSPLMMQLLSRGQENMNMRPQPFRLQPPNVNNPYQPGVGANPAPPPVTGMPFLEAGESMDPVMAARRTLMGRVV